MRIINVLQSKHKVIIISFISTSSVVTVALFFVNWIIYVHAIGITQNKFCHPQFNVDKIYLQQSSIRKTTTTKKNIRNKITFDIFNNR